jgi:hypothetical protein
MLRNLKAEILKSNLDNEVLARALGVKSDTFRRKLNEDISISLKECTTIKEKFFPDLSLDYLFRKGS